MEPKLTVGKLERAGWILLGGIGLWGIQAASQLLSKGDHPSPISAAQAATKRPTMEERKRDVAAVVSAGPQTKLWSTPHGEIIELAIPTAAVGGHFVQFKRCTVWRDPITATSSISCPADVPEERDLYPTDQPDLSDLR